MRHLLFTLMIFATSISCAKDKQSYMSYSSIYDIKGTDNVVISLTHYNEAHNTRHSFLFMNVLNGKEKQIDFPENTYPGTVEQVKLDDLNINKIIFLPRSSERAEKKFAKSHASNRMIICTTDGDDVKQITDEGYYIQNWKINEKNGIIVITGYHTETRRNEIILFDLKKMKKKEMVK